MMVNNEIGTVRTDQGTGGSCEEAQACYFHTDAVQGLGNVPIDVKDTGSRLPVHVCSQDTTVLRALAHSTRERASRIPEFHARRCTGNASGEPVLRMLPASWDSARLQKWLRLESGAPSGALHVSCSELFLREEIEEKHQQASRLNGPRDQRHPGNLNVSLRLYRRGIHTADAGWIRCRQYPRDPHVLRNPWFRLMYWKPSAFPITKMNGAVRFTVGDFTTKEDIDYTVDALINSRRKTQRILSGNGTGRMVDNMAMYNDTVIDHFMNPHNVGEIEDASGIGTLWKPGLRGYDADVHQGGR